MVFPFEFPGLGKWEGARTRLFSLSRGLIDRGVEVHVLSKPDPEFSASLFENIRLHRLRTFANLTGANKFLSSLVIGNELRQLDREFGFDVVHLHLPVVAASVALWKNFISANTIFDTHDWYKLHDELYYNIKSFPNFLSGLVDATERQIATQQDGVLITTPLLLKFLGRNARPFVVPNAVDTFHFKPLPFSNFRNNTIPKNSFVIGFLGSVSIHQGVWKLLEAAKMLSSKISGLKVLIVGGGSVQEARTFAKKLGISDNVIFTGPNRVAYSEIPDLINAMDVAMSPLQKLPRYHEYAQPLKVLEYMACGIPIIGTPLNEQARLIKTSNSGLVTQGFEANELADAIVSIHDDYARFIESRESFRNYAITNHSNRSVIDSLQNAYSKVVDY